ncbi:flagellar hook-length control protein FliK [Halomonas sp. HNIBRBA4712]|uniref:flagellar hook-length control protein FliK n=1 Tax=Halomonas sp. HNIBRBA4712 TaxID=3373087 RepID=UPI003746285F
MTMTLLLQPLQNLRGALSTLNGGQTPQSQSAPAGFQSALRQAFDTRAGSAPSQAAPETAPLEAFRDALAALGADVDTLDDNELRALFDATEQALSSKVDSPESNLESIAQLLAQAKPIDALAALGAEAEALDDADLEAIFHSTEQASSSEAASPETNLANVMQALTQARPAQEPVDDALAALGAGVEALDDADLNALFHATEQALSSAAAPPELNLASAAQLLTRAESDQIPAASAPSLNEPALLADEQTRRAQESGIDFQSALPADDALLDVQARLALVAAFTGPANAEAAAASSRAPALGDAAARLLSALEGLRPESGALRSGTEPSASAWSASERPTWSTQPLMSLYASAATTNSEPLDADPLPATLTSSVSTSALQGALGQTGANGEQTLAATAPTIAASAPAANTPGLPLASSAFPEKLGQQLIQLTQRGGEQQVKLELHPAELGPLTITLKVGEQHTQAQFFSAHAQVRQIVEQAIPQLREALAEQGISLGETSVGEQGRPGEQGAFANARGGARSDGRAPGDDAGEPIEGGLATPVRLTLDGRVDLYA